LLAYNQALNVTQDDVIYILLRWVAVCPSGQSVPPLITEKVLVDLGKTSLRSFLRTHWEHTHTSLYRTTMWNCDI